MHWLLTQTGASGDLQSGELVHASATSAGRGNPQAANVTTHAATPNMRDNLPIRNI